MTSPKLLFALLPMIGIGTTLATAAPLPKLDGAVPPAVTAPVEKVHGWHRYCAWGPAHYHRHVPGVGNVGCGHPGYGFYSRPYVDTWRWSSPRPYYWRHGHRHHGRRH